VDDNYVGDVDIPGLELFDHAHMRDCFAFDDVDARPHRLLKPRSLEQASGNMKIDNEGNIWFGGVEKVGKWRR
jgi:hypothetical protein